MYLQTDKKNDFMNDIFLFDSFFFHSGYFLMFKKNEQQTGTTCEEGNVLSDSD